ncbi:HNH endonuclease [Mycobacterium sp. URHB0044]|uniref:HNH endonuclease n=1 Tax=Mycobacterium sp. URHB0044 TaxID=1380386 RepID=UPI00048C4C93|nr:HNH endonuclease [Mycobacterium sp. URHB0044]
MSILMHDLNVDVYNADYRVLSRIPWQDAIRLILRGAVYVIDLHDPAVRIHGPSLVIELPMSVALREYVHIPHETDLRVTRDGVLRRDERACAYCGRAADTVDHVLPRSRGGGDTWFNLVAACQACNGLKGNRTPGEAGMRLSREPFEPRQRDRFRCPPQLV